MNHLPVSEESWKKIVYWSRRNAGVRVVNIAWIAVYLFCYHFCLALAGTRHSQRLAVAMSICMMISLLSATSPFTVYADEEEETPAEEETENSYELSIELSGREKQDGFEAELTEGYESPLEFVIALTNTGNATLTKITASAESLTLYWENARRKNPS